MHALIDVSKTGTHSGSDWSPALAWLIAKSVCSTRSLSTPVSLKMHSVRHCNYFQNILIKMVMINEYWNRNKLVCCELIITRMLGENSISALGWTSADGIGGGVMAADDGLVGALGPPKIFIAHFSTIASSIISGILQHLAESYVWEILIISSSQLNIWKCVELLYLYFISMYATIPKIYYVVRVL